MIEKLLKSKNIKVTKQRMMVLESIKELDLNANIKNIIKSNTTIDKSTIYRIIDVLEQNNIISKNLNESNEVYYQINEGHEHFIICSKCHKKEKINICPIDEIALKGYEITSHKIEIIGLCNNCK